MTLYVNGRPIPEQAIQFEVDRLVKFYSEHMSPEQIREQMDVLRRRARDQAVGARLLVDEVKRLDIQVPADEVEARLQAMIDQAGGDQAFGQLLERQSLSLATVRESIGEGRRVDQLVDRITQGLSDPTEDEIQAHFNAHGGEYRKPDRVQAQHILVKPHSESEQDRAAACAKLLEIRQKIEEGADFTEQAAAHSECPSGKKTGGSLGWVSRGMTLPALDEAMFSMEVDTLSDVVETPLGLHLIKKLDAADGGEADYEDAREKIREFLRHVRRGEAVTAYVAELKAKAVIEER